jgi:16S rRNA (adenine1518-N6/adenine1519-N6)-dimethyltransferase
MNPAKGPAPRPKRRFSQNFLVDPNMAVKIASIVAPCPDDDVVEIGPGTGALTTALLKTGARLLCVEVDKELAERLADTFKQGERFEVIVADALEFSFTGLSKESGKRFKLVSNLPYNISGPMLAKLIDERDAFTAMALMFQKEVAERILARPGTKEYGSLSVLAQAYMDVRREFDVPPRLFRPVPAVMSTVVSLRVLPSPRVEIEDEAWFKRVVRSAFGQRRKTLLNALATLGLDRKVLEEGLSSAGIDSKRRGETLSIEEFAKLSAALKAA